MTSRYPKSVWRDLTDTPGEALDLELRAQLLMQIQAILEGRDIDNTAGALCSDELVAIKKGHIHALTLESLVRVAALLGCEATVELRRPVSGRVDE